MLTGAEIKKQMEIGNIFISHFDEKRLGPNSCNLRLGDKLLMYDRVVLDPKRKNRFIELPIKDTGFTLRPGVLYLGETMEYTETRGFVPMLEGRSSVGRLGIHIHATAGFGDIGFKGKWTLELSCVQPVLVYPGMEICQIFYLPVEGEIQDTYEGKYQWSEGVRASEMWREFHEDPLISG